MNNDEERDTTTTTTTTTTTAVDLINNNNTRFYGWPSSRIVRVSRASGGKDRHSKVLTSKGLRDRRVRLSVNTAIQFYDLQDRLGYDQPSKAVEWLLKAAASSIDELPPISAPAAFCEVISRQGSDDKSNGDGSDQLGFERGGEEDVVMDGGGGGGGGDAAVSSNSENSKGSSGLSLSRSESRIKARERAKGRVKESGSKFRSREKENENEAMNPNISQTTSFTELLSGGITNVPNGSTIAHHDMFQKSQRPWSATPMEYYATGLLAPPQFSMAEDHNYPFVPENLNFTISSSATNAGFNRGTLQSNSSSSPSNLLPHFQRFDGSSPSFLISPAVENHHQFLYGFDGRLNGNNGRHSDQREGKGKN